MLEFRRMGGAGLDGVVVLARRIVAVPDIMAELQ